MTDERTDPVDRLSHQHPNVNVGDGERLVTAFLGGALALLGLRRGILRGAGLTLSGIGLAARAATGHCPAYQALGLSTAKTSASTSVPAKQGVRVKKSVIVGRPAADLFAYWRKLENLPRVMSHLESVTETADGRSHWVARSPLGGTVAWDAEVINEIEGELLSWRSLDGSLVDSAGSVRFAQLPHRRGTKITVVLKYNPPAGKVGVAVARLLGVDPETQIEGDLARFKQFMEADEPAEALPSGGSQPAGKPRTSSVPRVPRVPRVAQA